MKESDRPMDDEWPLPDGDWPGVAFDENGAWEFPSWDDVPELDWSDTLPRWDDTLNDWELPGWDDILDGEWDVPSWNE